ncbi:MAG: hypothetical protein Q8J66_04070 [Methylotenera sp.]|nr:hypothetical protein [Methylotenera sp.]
MKTCHPAIQLHCPYTSKLLTEIDSVNAEHILPFALGAPQNFTVLADASENSRMANLIDTPCTNDPLIRMLAVAAGVESRSGRVVLKTSGTNAATGDEIRASISQDGLKFRYQSPVDFDHTTGLPTAVKGFNDEAAVTAEQIKIKYASKGIDLELGDTVLSSNPDLHFSFNGNLNLLQQELIKIAYLMTVFVFGDEAILSDNGDLFRTGIMAKDFVELAKVGIGGGSGVAESMAFMPKSQPNNHVLTCFTSGSNVISAVSLFGVFSACYITPARGIACEPLTGKVVTIRPSTKAITCISYLDWLKSHSF